MDLSEISFTGHDPKVRAHSQKPHPLSDREHTYKAHILCMYGREFRVSAYITVNELKW